jgi:signal transduction histidine kinase
MQLGQELIREQLFFRKELIERAEWFIRLRWIFVFGGALAGVVARRFWPPLPLTACLAILAVVGGYNLALATATRRALAAGDDKVPRLTRLAHVQMVCDLSALAALIYLSGGLFSPLAPFFLFHVILAGFFLSPESCYGYGALILGLLAAMTAAVHLSLAPFWPVLFHDPGATAPPGPAATAGVFALYAAMVAVTTLITTSIKVSLRAKGRELLKISRDLDQNNRKLTALYEMVKEMGSHTGWQALMDNATRQAARIMGVKGCAIKLLDAQGRRLRFASVYGLSADYVANGGIEIEKSTINRRILQGSGYAVGRIQERDIFQFPEQIRKEGIEAMVCLPLRMDKRVSGVFCVYSDRSDFFSDEDVQFFAMMCDLTALAMAQLHSELNKTWFLHKAAHQLRGPLHAIQTMLDTLRREYPGPLNADQQQTLARAGKRLGLLDTMIRDLLDLGLRRDPEADQPLQPMDLGRHLTGEAGTGWRAQAETRGVHLSMEADGELPLVLASGTMIEDLFGNLIVNAIKYTPSGGRVSVKLSTETDGTLRCEIADSGIGIPEEAMDRLFSEFFRAPNARAFCEEGTGLGLAIVKEVLSRLHGTIRITSRPAQGTQVSVWLPAHSRNPTKGRQ